MADDWTVKIEGLPELQARLSSVDKEVKRGIRKRLQELAKPVTELGRSKGMGAGSTRLPHSPRWTQLRAGVSSTELYVVPKQRGGSRYRRTTKAKRYAGMSGHQIAGLDRGESFPRVFWDHELQPMADEAKPLFEASMRELERELERTF